MTYLWESLMNVFMLLILLIGAHYFLDYAGQGQFMSDAKSATRPVQGVPWYQVMTAHAFLHAAATAALTGLWWLVFPEFVIHFVTDTLKCKNKISFSQDQSIHLICKVVWWVIAIYMMKV